jgi:hypothetical protein
VNVHIVREGTHNNEGPPGVVGAMRALVAAVMLLLAGCLVPVGDEARSSDGTDDSTPSPFTTSASSAASDTYTSPAPQPMPEPDTLFVTVARSFGFNRTAGSGPSYGPSFYGGQHCGGASYTLDPLRVTVHVWSPHSSSTGATGTTDASAPKTSSGPAPDSWGPEGILFTGWDQSNITNHTYSTFGHGPGVVGFGVDGGPLLVPAAFSPAGPVANLTAQGGEVRVDGRLLQQGVPLTVRMAYSVTQGSGSSTATYAVQERLDFTLHGLASVVTQVMGSYCY